MNTKIFRQLILAVSLAHLAFFSAGCSTGAISLDRYASAQEKKIVEKSLFNQAELDFTVAVFQPTSDELAGLQASWTEHGQAFPESTAIKKIQEVIGRSGSQAVLVSLYTTNTDRADLKNKAQGWAVSPVPAKITELADGDQVVRKLMPTANPWARYFLLEYSGASLSGSEQFVVSNTTNVARLPLRR